MKDVVYIPLLPFEYSLLSISPPEEHGLLLNLFPYMAIWVPSNIQGGHCPPVPGTGEVTP